MHTPPDQHPGRIGPYRVLDLLGRGGMGVVYRGVHEQTGQLAAIKTVHTPLSGGLESLRREIQALARIRHPGIVRILGEGLHEGLPWYAMELVEGRSLLDVVAELRDSSLEAARTPAAADAATQTSEPQVAPAAAPAADPDRTATTAGTATGLEPTDAALTSEGEADAAPGPAGAEAPLGPLAPQPPAPPRLQPASLYGAVALVRRLCDALGYLHGEGLVHRDLKPSNVLIRSAPTPDPRPPTPVLMDFGIVSRFPGELAREQLEVPGRIIGTLAYMAPEQCRGELVDARADLYALGCLLYELVAGRPPFVGLKAARLLYLHCNAEPAPPSTLVEGVPPALEALILRLLAKEPRRRLGYAGDVARALDAVLEAQAREGAERQKAKGKRQKQGRIAMRSPANRTGGGMGPESREPGQERAPRARPYLYRPALAGRHEMLDALGERLWEAGASRGSVLLLGGESGVGKTRLAMALAHEAQTRGFCVLAGECEPGVGGRGSELGEPGPAPGERAAADRAGERAAGGRAGEWEPTRGGAPLEALRRPLRAIADLCREGGPDVAARLVGRRAGGLAPIEPDLGRLPGLEAPPPAADLPPESARQQLYEALGETLAALCAEKPVLLVLDDLQWADELTCGLLAHLARELAGQGPRLLVLGTYRTEEQPAALRELLARPAVGRMELGRLDEAAVGAIVADMLALEAPPRVFARFLAQHSEGNPFFVAEYLRTAVAEGLLYRDAAGRWAVGAEDEVTTEATYEALPLPRSLRELVRRRLDGLRPAVRSLAEAAAVVGREVDAAVLAQTAGLDDVALAEAAAALVRRQVLEPAGDDGWRFVHDKIREVAHTGIEPGRRRALHAAAARAVEARFGTGRFEHLAAVGRHWDEAGEPRLAARYRARAGERAAASYAAREGLRELDRAIPVLGRSRRDPEDRAALRAALDARARLLNQLGRFARAGADARRLARLSRAAGDPRREGRALREAGLAAYNLGDYARALELYGQSLQVLEPLGDPEELCWTRSFTGWIHASQGRHDEAEAHFQAALSQQDLPESSPARLNCMMKQALTLYQRGRLSEAMGIYEDLLRRYEDQGDTYNRALCRAALAQVYREMRDTDRALSMLTEAREVFGRLHAVQYHMLHGYNIGVLLVDQGQFDKSSRILRETRNEARLHREVFLAAGTSVSLASCSLPRGRLAEAIRLTAFASRTFEHLGDRSWLSSSLMWEGEAHAAAGHDTAADERFGRALELAGELDTPQETWKICLYWSHCRLERSGPTGQGLALARQAAEAAARTGNEAHALLAGVLLDLHEGHWELYEAKMARLHRTPATPQLVERSFLAGAEAALASGQLHRAAKLLQLYRRRSNPENVLHTRRAARVEASLPARIAPSP